MTGAPVALLTERRTGGVATSGTDVVVSALAAAGVRRVYTVPGRETVALLDALSAARIGVVVCRHEQGCGFAADGEARALGRPAVVLLPTGPACTNVVTAMANAAADAVQVVLLAVGEDAPAGRPDRIHWIDDQCGLFRAVVGTARRVERRRDLETVLPEALAGPRSGLAFPVYLEISAGLLTRTGPTGAAPTCAAGREPAEPPATVVSGALVHASRPVLVAGVEAAGTRELDDLARAAGAVVLYPGAARSGVHRDVTGTLGSILHLPIATRILAAADVVAQLGCTPGEADFWDVAPRQVARLVTCASRPGGLLHGTARHDDVAVPAGGIVDLVRASAELLRRSHPAELRTHGPWVRQCQRDVMAALRRAPRRWAKALPAIGAAVGRDGYLTCDTTRVVFEGALTSPDLLGGPALVYPGGFSPLGYAVPAALGIKQALPAAKVVAIVGDGGLYFSMPELVSLAEQGCNVPVVVSVNRAYGSIGDHQRMMGLSSDPSVLPPTDWRGVAEAVGCAAASADSPTRLGELVAAALRRGQPTLILAREGLE